MNELPVIVLGMGGHAKVLIDTLRLRKVEILGVTDPDPLSQQAALQLGLTYLGDDEAVEEHRSSHVRLVNGLGTVGVSPQRKALFERFKQRGYSFFSVIHPSAVIAGDVKMGEGVQIMAGAVVQAGSEIGVNSIVNTHASVDHDCRIGAHVHLAPGVVLSGGVVVEEGSHLGTGVTVTQGVHIPKEIFVKAAQLVSPHTFEVVSEKNRILTEVTGRKRA